MMVYLFLVSLSLFFLFTFSLNFFKDNNSRSNLFFLRFYTIYIYILNKFYLYKLFKCIFERYYVKKEEEKVAAIIGYKKIVLYNI